MQPRSEIAVSYNTTDAKWQLDEMVTYKGANSQKSELLEGEELNKEKLDEVRSSLGDVKIVDVYPKPKGLGATLKASGDFANDMEARRSLEARGFILHPETHELLSANGELHALTKDGVEYILRFGNVAGEEQGSAEGKLNRYLFVTARVDESKIPQPVLEEVPMDPAAPSLPPTEPGAKPADSEKTSASGACGQEEEKPAEPAADTKPSAAQETGEKPADAKPSDVPAEEAAGKEAAPAKDAAAPADKAADKPATTADEVPPAPTTDAKADGRSADGKSTTDDDLQKKKRDAERDRIIKDNQRKLDEWNNKKNQAQEKVNELNARFADWYYVISEDVYKKLHLSRSDIVREGAKAAEEGIGVDAFRKLEEDGLEKKPESKPAAPSFEN
jgi:hypothetical protein